jgi:hypothetical protein
VGATALLLGGGALLRWLSAGYKDKLTAAEVPIALSDKELAIMKTVVDTLAPEADGFPSGVALGVHQRIDEELWAAAPAARDEAKAAIQVFEHAPLTKGYGSRFTALAPAERLAYFEKILAGDNDTLRLTAVGLKQLVHLFYYTRPDTWKKMGYEGPFVPKPVPPASHVAYEKLLVQRRGGAS